MNLLNFNQKFNLKWGLAEQADEFKEFKNRILNVFYGVDHNITSEGHKQFCSFLGIRCTTNNVYGSVQYEANIIGSLEKTNNTIELMRMISLILNLPFNSNPPLSAFITTHSFQSKYYQEVKEAIELSHLHISLEVSDGTIFIVPVGEKILDNELLSPVLSFLNKESNEHFINALNAFVKKEYIQSAEQIRRTLEEFLRFKLKNKKSLENNIIELAKELKNHRAEQNIINMIIDVFKKMGTYFNDNSKHGAGALTKYEAWYLVYQSAIFIRYIHDAFKN